MKKINLIIYLMIISIMSVWGNGETGKDLLTANFSVSAGYSNGINEPNGSLKISSKGKKAIYCNDIIFAAAGETIYIEHNKAIVGGGDIGGSDLAETFFYLNNNKIDYKTTILTMKENGQFLLEIKKARSNIIDPEPIEHIKILCKSDIDYDSSKPYVTGYEDTLYMSTSDNTLSVICKNAYGIEGISGWFVQKGSLIKITYSENLYHDEGCSPGNEIQSGTGWNYDKYNRLFINGLEYASENNTIYAEENLIIEIKKVVKDSTKEATTYTDFGEPIEIKVYEGVPTISISPEYEQIKDWIKFKTETGSIKVEANSGGMDIKTFEIIKKDDTDYLKSNKDGSPIEIENDGIYTITVKDLIDNTVEQTIKIDNTAPVINIEDNEGKELKENATGWYTASEINIKAEDKLSGIENVTQSKNSSEAENKPACYKITENGIYEIKATDKVGNEKKETIKLDKTVPVMENKKVIYTKGDRLIGRIKASVIIREEGSGIEKTVTGIYEKITENEENKISGETNGGEITAEISNIDRKEKQTYKLIARAADKAGNKDYWEFETITLPAEIKITEEESYIEEGYTVTKLKLENYKGNEEYYKDIKLQRIIYIDGKEITEENFTEYFEEEARADWEEITQIQEITAEKIKEGIYKDKIRTGSGFGHKETGYKISWAVQGLQDEEGKTIREESEEIKVVTADNPGTVRMKIEGKEGKEQEVNLKDGTITEELELGADGEIKIWISIEDEDYEPYETEVRQLINETDSGAELSVVKEGFIQKGISGKAKYDGYEKKYGRGKWISYEKSEYLSYNRETCLYLRVKEGYSGKERIRELKKIYLKAEPNTAGGFNLKVCEGAGYNAKGITAKPYQKVELELSGAEENVKWKFGDEKTASGKRVEHKWGQKADREGDISEYVMEIECNGNSVKVPVHIEDTKSGTMYGDEVWYGKHEILGKIEVKEGQTLSIGSVNWGKEMEVLCIADKEEDSKGCLEIKGNLKIENGGEKVIITAGVNTTDGIKKEEREINREYLYWKGIEIKEGGKADITGVEIRGSERGIAIEGEVTIKDSTLKGNGTGLHVLGKCEAENIEVMENEEYGIKEESDCEVTIKSSCIEKNVIDWYDWNEGILSQNEIDNKLK